MPRLVRKQVYLEASQDRRVKKRASAEGVAEAVVIRRALDVGLDRLMAQSSRPTPEGARFLVLVDRLIAAGPVRGRRRWTRDALYDRSDRSRAR